MGLVPLTRKPHLQNTAVLLFALFSRILLIVIAMISSSFLPDKTRDLLPLSRLLDRAPLSQNAP
jgi:hypothetical protein